MTRLDVMRAHHFDLKELRKTALNSGVGIETLNEGMEKITLSLDTNVKTKDENFIKISSSRYGVFEMQRGPNQDSHPDDRHSMMNLPRYINISPAFAKLEGFSFFETITPQEPQAFYEAVLPAIHLMQRKIFEYRQQNYCGRMISLDDLGSHRAFFEAITIGDIIDVIQAGTLEMDREPQFAQREAILA